MQLTTIALMLLQTENNPNYFDCWRLYYAHWHSEQLTVLTLEENALISFETNKMKRALFTRKGVKITSSGININQALICLPWVNPSLLYWNRITDAKKLAFVQLTYSLKTLHICHMSQFEFCYFTIWVATISFDSLIRSVSKVDKNDEVSNLRANLFSATTDTIFGIN